MFSASFRKIIEEDQRNNEIKLYINSNIKHNLSGSDIDDIDKFQLEHQIRIQETEESCWLFVKKDFNENMTL